MSIIPLPSQEEWTGLLQYHTVKSGQRFAFQEAGDTEKPALVLLHGFVDSSRGFRNVAKYLTEDFHLYMVDMPGHGKSSCPDTAVVPLTQMAEDVHFLLHDLDLVPAQMFGHSLGSLTILTLASLYPDDVAKIGLGAATLHADPEPEFYFGFMDRSRNFPENRFNEEFVYDWLVTSNHYYDEEYRKYLTKDVQEMDPNAFLACTMGALLADHRLLASAITAPAMVVWGPEDALFGRPHQDIMEACIPTFVREYTLEGVGHEILQEGAEGTAKAILDFFK